ncbi:DMT family transporter [Aureimonas altamirensis]|uniref:DMT family transporter n=1 Tax=Aureimonas altamirensis TaxID=370622 RepID=UPI00203669C9|nr:DMT family transporter [Aureimonas altamirensis]MCM2505427.1 DMT family transporter [Aureimonas altamirensis]
MAWVTTIVYSVSPRLRGIAAIVLAVFLLSLSDALVKLAGDRFGLAQLILLRSLVAGGLIGAGFWIVSGLRALRAKRLGWVSARSLCLTAMWATYYAALPSMSFALAAACYYTAPIWMALMARFWLGVAIGTNGWAAIGLSSLGVLLAVNPAVEQSTFAVLLPLAAAMFYALAGTITWRWCRNETAGAMAFNLNLCLVAVAGLGILALSLFRPGDGEGFVLALWPELSAPDFSLAVILGVLLAFITTTVALAYRLAPTPLVGIFDNSYLGFAALWSALLLADTLNPGEAAGIVLIAAGALLMSRRNTTKE